MSLLQIIPWPLREAVHRMLEIPARRRTAARRADLKRADFENVRLGFGGVLDDGRPIHGGAVKLLPLRDAFGADGPAINVLYAVSSSQPRFAEDLVRTCRGLGIRFVWNQNGVGYPAWAGAESERYNRPMRRLRALADFVVYQSEFCRVSARRFLGPCDIPSVTLFNPVDTVQFSPAISREDGPLRLLAAGTHGTRDRVMPVLEALETLRSGGLDVCLTVAGEFRWPDAERDFAEEIRRRNVAEFVTRKGRFSHREAAALYQAHDVLIHPKYMDPCPTVVIEAMACGLPVVGSCSGGMPEMVPEACGRLIPAPEDWDERQVLGGSDLAAAILDVAGRRAEMALAARAHVVSNFELQPWVDAHGKVFRGLLQ